MESKKFSNTKRTAGKLGLLAAISLLMLIPLAMIKGLINNRDNTKEQVKREIAEAYAGSQLVYAPRLQNTAIVKSASNPSETSTHTNTTMSSEVNYFVDVETESLHRSIYDVIVYNSSIKITGRLTLDSYALGASRNEMRLNVSDFKGLSSIPQIRFGDKTYSFRKRQINKDIFLGAMVELPQDAKIGDTIDYEITMNVNGSEKLLFEAYAAATTLNMSSAYPHPSFQGGFLPVKRDVSEDGFNAEWKVLWMNVNADDDDMGVRFVEPANPYQQAMRSAKYGIIIIILMFVAGLFVEFLSRREINIIQYAVIGLSLVLFYSLLLSLSEFMVFGLAYLIAAAMTTGSLVLYFRAILRNRSAYILGLFTAAVYGVNYILIQMETYALLAGSMVLFVLLCLVMHLTADADNSRKSDKQ